MSEEKIHMIKRTSTAVFDGKILWKTYCGKEKLIGDLDNNDPNFQNLDFNKTDCDECLQNIPYKSGVAAFIL